MLKSLSFLCRHPFFLVGICYFSFGHAPLYAQVQRTTEVEQIDFANGLFGRGLYDMAQTEYQKYMQDYTDGLYREEALFGSAESLFFEGRYQDAIEAYQTFQETFPLSKRQALAQLRSGQALFHVDKIDQALVALQKTNREALNPALKQALDYYLGRSFYVRKNYVQALIFLVEAAKQMQEKQYLAQSFLLMGNIYTLQNQNELAQAVYTQAEQSGENKQIQALALFKNGEIAFQQGLYEQAMTYFQKLMEHYPDLDISKKAFLNHMTAMYNADAFDEVIAAFLRAEKDIPREEQSSRMYIIAMNAYLQLGLNEEAVQAADRGLAFDHFTAQEKTDLVLKKAEGLIKAERMEEAYGIVQNQTKQGLLDSAEGLFLQAESLFGLQKYEGAVDYYQRISREYPQSIYADDARWSVALAYKSLGDNEKALDAFARYVEKGQDSLQRAHALYNMILMRAQDKKFEKAISLASKYLQEYPNQKHDEEVRFLLAHFYQNTGAYQQALSSAEEYFKRYPSSERIAEMRFFIGYTHQLAGESHRAVAAYQSLISREGQTSFVEAALKNTAVLQLSLNLEEEAAVTLRRLHQDFPEQSLLPDTSLWLLEYDLNNENYQKVLDVAKTLDQDVWPEELLGRFLFVQAEAHRFLEQYDQAMNMYDVIIGLKKEQDMVMASYLGKAQIYQAKEEWKKAKGLFQDIIEQFPDAHTVLIRSRYALAEIAVQENQLDEAVKLYLLVDILYEDPHYSSQALFQAGTILEQLGSREKAHHMFMELQNKYPESLSAKEWQSSRKDSDAQ